MLQFSLFDHLDHNGASLGDQLEDRLKLIGVLETEGYYAYHVAEHHSTRLGMTPSPGVFLAAVAQRTRSIKFGPLVYVLPLHHPLRLYEEICMLDHLSGGRLQWDWSRWCTARASTLWDRSSDGTGDVSRGICGADAGL